MRIEHPFRSAFDLIVKKTPLEGQLVVIRRCNLSCGYCTEYDQHSPEVPFETLAPRIDALHRLRVQNIALLGGEPLLHTRIADLVRRAAAHSQVSMTTNGFLIDRDIIERLGDAGLTNLQISIDSLRVDPSHYVQKTLRSLKPKLERLARYARFDVHITTVLCGATVAEFDELMGELGKYPFRVSVNIMHDEHGQAMVQGPEFERAWTRHFESGRAFSYLEEDYGRRLLAGEKPDWTCRAGSRFLYVDEHGTVELCSGQRGRIGKDIESFTAEDIRAQHDQPKGCEKGCSILCVYRDSLLDNDPRALARALFRGIRAGAFRWSDQSPPAAKPPQKRHLPLVARS
jgi:MoaA/NifB/PqqE/SkfB family radical SAM enzyme